MFPNDGPEYLSEWTEILGRVTEITWLQLLLHIKKSQLSGVSLTCLPDASIWRIYGHVHWHYIWRLYTLSGHQVSRRSWRVTIVGRNVWTCSLWDLTTEMQQRWRLNIYWLGIWMPSKKWILLWRHSVMVWRTRKAQRCKLSFRDWSIASWYGWSENISHITAEVEIYVDFATQCFLYNICTHPCLALYLQCYLWFILYFHEPPHFSSLFQQSLFFFFLKDYSSHTVFTAPLCVFPLIPASSSYLSPRFIALPPLSPFLCASPFTLVFCSVPVCLWR